MSLILNRRWPTTLSPTDRLDLCYCQSYVLECIFEVLLSTKRLPCVANRSCSTRTTRRWASTCRAALCEGDADWLRKGQRRASQEALIWEGARSTSSCATVMTSFIWIWLWYVQIQCMCFRSCRATLVYDTPRRALLILCINFY